MPRERPQTESSDLAAADDALFEEVRSGVPGAWERMVGRYENLVYSVAVNMGLSPADAHEVCQATWMLVHDHAKHIRRPASLASWLLTTAGREAWRYRRKLAREREIDTARTEGGQPEGSPTPDEVIERLERVEEVRAAVEDLDPRCRRLLQLLFFEPRELEYQEIAGLLRMPVGSIGPTRARCLLKLARRVQHLDPSGAS